MHQLREQKVRVLTRMTFSNYTVLFLCGDPSLGGSTQSLFYLIESLSGSITPIVLFGSRGTGIELFEKHGIECHVYPFVLLQSFRKNSLFSVISHPWRWHIIKKLRSDYGCLRFVKRFLNGRNVDIVHTNYASIDVGVLISKKLGAKHIWHIREFLDLDFHFSIYGGIDRLRIKIAAADRVIAVSTAIANHYCINRQSNAVIIHNPICPMGGAIYIENKEQYCLFVSSFITREKGVGIAIDAFEKSGLSSKGFILKIVGNIADGYKDALIQGIRFYKCKSAIEFIPFQNNVKYLFAKASCFIMTSNYEGFGRVTAEAMFFGCPVIARATGGTLDLIKDYETGYLFQSEDECAKLLHEVCTSNQDEIIRKAQDYAVKNFSTEVYGPKIFSLYHNVVLGK